MKIGYVLGENGKELVRHILYVQEKNISFLGEKGERPRTREKSLEERILCRICSS